MSLLLFVRKANLVCNIACTGLQQVHFPPLAHWHALHAGLLMLAKPAQMVPLSTPCPDCTYNAQGRHPHIPLQSRPILTLSDQTVALSVPVQAVDTAVAAAVADARVKTKEEVEAASAAKKAAADQQLLRELEDKTEALTNQVNTATEQLRSTETALK